jgi:hypothetical protein
MHKDAKSAISPLRNPVRHHAATRGTVGDLLITGRTGAAIAASGAQMRLQSAISALRA